MFKSVTYHLKEYGWSILLLLICIAIPLDFRWSSYLVVVSYLVAIGYHAVIKKRPEWNFFNIACLLFFIWQSIEVLNSENVHEAVKQLERKVSFVFLPLLWHTLNHRFKHSVQHILFNYFPIAMGILGGICIGVAFYNYSRVSNVQVFYYHNLVHFIEANAVYFSCCLLISTSLLFNRLNTQHVYVKSGLIVLYMVFLYLLSSKMFWVLSVVTLCIYILRSVKSVKRIGILAGMLTCALLVSQTGILKDRYNEVLNDKWVLNPTEITPSTTFTGINFRMYLLQKGLGMVSETPKSFILGRGTGDVQDQLNQKYIDDNLYLGNQTNGDNGYLNYNFHNQYMQTLTESGVIGLVLLLFIIGSLIIYGIRTKNESLVFLNVMFAIAFFTESYLNRSMGVFLFLVFNSVFLSINDSANQRFKFEKRCLDILGALFGMIFILGWLMPLISIIIWLDMKHNPVFVQKRVGQNGKPFFCYKFRTMIDNTEAHTLPAKINDVRITKIGYWLRKLGIDELPQLYNVLKGDMSLVGPRPLMVQEEQMFNKVINQFSSRLVSKPGITGLSQCNGKKGYVESVYDIRERYRIDKLYSKKQSVELDIKILMKTLYTMYISKK